MENEEAKEILFDMLGDSILIEPTKQNKAIIRAIKALEQEPCECTEHPCLGKLCRYYKEPCDDAISRQAAIDAMYALCGDETLKENPWRDNPHIDAIVDCLNELHPVTPPPKTGRWIMKHRTHNEVKHYTGQDEMGEIHTISVLERYEVDEPYCSECGKRAGDTSQDYCCACGAKMVEPQESEVDK